MGKKVIGIDFGTTNCCVAYYASNGIKVIQNIEGATMTPSVVSFKGTELLVGDVAKRQALTNVHTVSSIKRRIGVDEKVAVNNKTYFPEQIASYIFSYLKYYAEEYIGDKVDHAVITVPAHFNNKQRHAIITSAKIAGLQVKRIINEPTAAALAYALDTSQKSKFLVFDWGGGTLDVSILQGEENKFTVIANKGDNFLGGDDIDELIIALLKKKILIENKNINVYEDTLINQRLKDAAERAKKELSSAKTATISLPFLGMMENGTPFNFEYTLTRSEFNVIAERLVKRAISLLIMTLEEAKIFASDIDRIVLVGGSTRILSLQSRLEQIFSKDKIARNVNVDEAIAVGAAIQAELGREESKLRFTLQDITPLSLGIESHLGKMDVLIERNSKIPKKVIKKYSTVEDNQEAVEINIFQGESPIAEENHLLGSLYLDNLPEGRVGEVFVYVEFEVDEDGIINVSVKNRETGLFKGTKIHTDNYMNEELLEKLIVSAKKNKYTHEEKSKEIDLLDKMYDRKLVIDRLLDAEDIGQKEKQQLKSELKTIEKGLINQDFKSLRKVEKVDEEKQKKLI